MILRSSRPAGIKLDANARETLRADVRAAVMTQSQIARKHAVSGQTVARWAGIEGVTLPVGGNGRPAKQPKAIAPDLQKYIDENPDVVAALNEPPIVGGDRRDRTIAALQRAAGFLLEAIDLPPRARNREKAIRECARELRGRIPGAIQQPKRDGPAAALFQTGAEDLVARSKAIDDNVFDERSRLYEHIAHLSMEARRLRAMVSGKCAGQE